MILLYYRYQGNEKKGPPKENLLNLPQNAGGKSYLNDGPPRGLSEGHT